MKTILLAELNERGKGKNIAALQSWLASFLTRCGFTVTKWRPGKANSWTDYDAVMIYVGVYDWQNLEHRDFLDELLMSRVHGQPRLVYDDDSYFKRWSLLKQAGFSDENEFTHRLVLNKSMVRSGHFSKFKHWESDSINKAIEIQCPLWSCPPEQLLDYAMYDASELRPSCYYAGYPKPDREATMAKLDSGRLVYGTKTSYLGNIMAATQHTAGLMLNSLSHCSKPTPRFYESASLSVQVWHKDIDVLGMSRRRVVDRARDLELLMSELSRQTYDQRKAEIELQVEQANSTLDLQISKWLAEDKDYGKLISIGASNE